MPATNPPGRLAFKTTLDGLDRRLRALEGQQNRPTVWTALALAANWTNYSVSPTTFALAQYTRDALGFIVVRGLVQKTTAWANGDTIATLPAGSRPAATNGEELFTVNGFDTGAGVAVFRVDACDDGTLRLLNAIPNIASPGTLSYLSLAGIRFMQVN